MQKSHTVIHKMPLSSGECIQFFIYFTSFYVLLNNQVFNKITFYINQKYEIFQRSKRNIVTAADFSGGGGVTLNCENVKKLDPPKCYPLLVLILYNVVNLVEILEISQ